jgi:hypothetical protein
MYQAYILHTISLFNPFDLVPDSSPVITLAQHLQNSIYSDASWFFPPFRTSISYATFFTVSIDPFSTRGTLSRKQMSVVRLELLLHRTHRTHWIWERLLCHQVLSRAIWRDIGESSANILSRYDAVDLVIGSIFTQGLPRPRIANLTVWRLGRNGRRRRIVVRIEAWPGGSLWSSTRPYDGLGWSHRCVA